jgi:hypothetical protein
MENNDHIWATGGTKSIALLWLRQKNSDLMEIANALRPQDPENQYEMDIFLDLISIYGALNSAIDMVEDVQKMVWAAEAKNSDLKLTIRNLTKELETYRKKFDNLDENLR